MSFRTRSRRVVCSTPVCRTVLCRYGFPKTIGGNATGTDRFLFGSGTKPFTATAIIRLQQQGLIKSLDDAASIYADPVLADLKPGTSLVGMLGARAGKVTVANLIQMQSGIADFDVPNFDNQVKCSTCAFFRLFPGT